MKAGKAAAKSASPKREKGKATKATKIAQVKVTADRAAKVDKNLGGSQSLRDFLTGAGWY